MTGPARVSGAVVVFIDTRRAADRSRSRRSGWRAGWRRSSARRWCHRPGLGRASVGRLGRHGWVSPSGHRCALRRVRPGLAAAIREVIAVRAPAAVVAAGSERGNEVPRPRGRPSRHADVREHDRGHPWRLVAGRPAALAGSLLEDASLDAPVRLLTVAPTPLPPIRRPPAPRAPTITRFRPELERDLVVRVVSASEGDGRGLAHGRQGRRRAAVRRLRDGFAKLEELASLLGGAVAGRAS